MRSIISAHCWFIYFNFWSIGEEPLAPDVVHPSSNCRSADGLLQPDGAGMFRRLSDTIMHQRRLLEESKRKRSTAAATRPLGRGTALRSTHTERNLIAKKRVIKMLAAIVIEFLVCWMPFYIFRTLLEFNMVNTVSQPVYSSLLILAFVSSCTNPITYCFMNKKFRQAFLLIFGCRQCAKPSGDSTMLCRIADKRRLPSVVAGGDGFPRINVITNRSGLDQSVNQALLTTDYSAGNLENSSYSAIDMPIRKQAVVVSDSPLNMATLLWSDWLLVSCSPLPFVARG